VAHGTVRSHVRQCCIKLEIDAPQNQKTKILRIYARDFITEVKELGINTYPSRYKYDGD